MSKPDYSKLIVPKSEDYVPAKKSECEYIYSFLWDKNIKSSLEIGFAYGFSTVYIVSATQSEHLVIDPKQKQWYKNYGKRNIKTYNYTKFVKLFEDYDYNVLPLLLKKKKKFDFIFIDGDHKFDSIFLDFFYADMMLKKGGYVMFHDSWMRATQLVASWISKNKLNYKRIDSTEKNIIVFQKIKEERAGGERPWHHFQEFYNFKAFHTYYFFRIFKKLWY